MGAITTFFRVKKANMSARVYRTATGKWEDLGMIASTSAWEMLKIKIKNLFK